MDIVQRECVFACSVSHRDNKIHLEVSVFHAPIECLTVAPSPCNEKWKVGRPCVILNDFGCEIIDPGLPDVHCGCDNNGDDKDKLVNGDEKDVFHPLMDQSHMSIQEPAGAHATLQQQQQQMTVQAARVKPHEQKRAENEQHHQ